MFMGNLCKFLNIILNIDPVRLARKGRQRVAVAVIGVYKVPKPRNRRIRIGIAAAVRAVFVYAF